MRTRKFRARRSPRAASLTWARLRRGLNRQWPLLLAATLVLGVMGGAFFLAGGASVTNAALWGFAAGGAAALVIAAMREFGRNTLTSIASLGRHRGYAILGAAPELTSQALRQLPPSARNPLGVAIFQPASAFASAFRDLQDSIAGDHVVAFVGAAPDNGATTGALCAAISAAQQGRRVIVVDCDIRRRSLSEALGSTAEAGVFEATEQPRNWRDFVQEEEETGLPYIPAAATANPWRTLVGGEGFATLMYELRGAFDLVVLDCPPALGNAEGALLARLADRCVLVTAWDDTPLGAIRRAMRALRGRSQAAIGIYVNRVPNGYRFGRLRPE